MLIIVPRHFQPIKIYTSKNICPRYSWGKYIFCHACYWTFMKRTVSIMAIISTLIARSRRGMSIMRTHRYNTCNTVLTMDSNVHSWFASVCYISRCNVSEVSIDLSDVECIERSNALAVSNGRCAGNRSSDGWLRFRKLPIRYRDVAICKNGGRRWLMREWLENSILQKKKNKNNKRCRNFRVPQ